MEASREIINILKEYHSCSAPQKYLREMAMLLLIISENLILKVPLVLKDSRRSRNNTENFQMRFRHRGSCKKTVGMIAIQTPNDYQIYLDGNDELECFCVGSQQHKNESL